jgi:hypothetical protein
MILNLIATALLAFLGYRRFRNAIEIWGGPYEDKLSGLLMCAGQFAIALIAIAAVWL